MFLVKSELPMLNRSIQVLDNELFKNLGKSIFKIIFYIRIFTFAATSTDVYRTTSSQVVPQ